MDFYLQRALDAIQRETSGMSDQQLAWHRPGKWSSAQVLEHLALTFSSTGKVMDRCVRQGRAEARKSTAREWLATTLVVRIGFFPTGRQAPEWTVPRGLEPAEAVAGIRAALVEMDVKIAAAEDKFGGGILAVHPLIGPLTAKQWRKFHWEHTRHHMRQVRALRAESAIARGVAAA